MKEIKSPTIIDKAIAFVSPRLALKREVARAKLNIFNSGYSHHGASRTKKSLIGWLFGSNSPDEDITDNLETLRQRSRDLFMGSPLATSAIKTNRSKIVGFGLRVKPQIDSEVLGLTPEEASAWERSTKREFGLFCQDCDAARAMNFLEMQALVCLSWLHSGEVFAALPMKLHKGGSPYALKVALIEADRISTPPGKPENARLRSGIETDSYGAPVRYHIAQKHPGDSFAGRNEWISVPAFGEKTGRRNILHILEFERPGQRRGVPLLAPVIESLKQLTRYSEAELMAAVVSGMFTVFIETPTADSPLGASPVPDDQQVQTNDANDYQLGNGAIIGLAPGEKAVSANPGRPNAVFDSFVTAITRQIGAALEMPYEVLIKHFTSSYSASRAALLEAWEALEMRRSWLVSRFCQPVYEEWLTEAVAQGRIKAPGFFDDPIIRQAYCQTEWHGPSPGQLDPLKEVNAAKVRVEQGFSTRSREAAGLTGSDYESNVRQLAEEAQLRKANGLEETGGGGNGGEQEVLEDPGQRDEPEER